MATERKRWVPRCQWCGKCGATTINSKKPTAMPTITGKCTVASNGKHWPKWEES